MWRNCCGKSDGESVCTFAWKNTSIVDQSLISTCFIQTFIVFWRLSNGSTNIVQSGIIWLHIEWHALILRLPVVATHSYDFFAVNSCNIKRLYLLIRPAITGEDATTTEDRLKLLLDTALFASLRKSHSNLINLIHPITGDLASPQLGLSSADRSILCENVQLIVHAGFETNFAAPLRRAALTNVRGTRELLQLAADCANLQAFGHVSTVFAQQPQTVCKPGCDTDDRLPIEERFYSTSIDPHRLLAILESNNATMDERTLETLANSLMRPWTIRTPSRWHLPKV